MMVRLGSLDPDSKKAGGGKVVAGEVRGQLAMPSKFKQLFFLDKDYTTYSILRLLYKGYRAKTSSKRLSCWI